MALIAWLARGTSRFGVDMNNKYSAPVEEYSVENIRGRRARRVLRTLVESKTKLVVVPDGAREGVSIESKLFWVDDSGRKIQFSDPSITSKSVVVSFEPASGFYRFMAKYAGESSDGLYLLDGDLVHFTRRRYRRIYPARLPDSVFETRIVSIAGIGKSEWKETRVGDVSFHGMNLFIKPGAYERFKTLISKAFCVEIRIRGISSKIVFVDKFEVGCKVIHIDNKHRDSTSGWHSIGVEFLVAPAENARYESKWLKWYRGLEEILYTFFRDARIAELTRVSGDIFRVFIQSQFTVLIAFFILVSLAVILWQRKQDRLLVVLGLIASWATILISMSRSFWVGAVVGLVSGVCFISYRRQPWLPPIADKIKSALIFILSALIGLVCLWGIIAFPFPENMGAGGLGSLLSDRATELDEAAARSRWNLVEPMLLEIKERPFIGSGFGTVIEYESEDPRVVAAGGKAETYAFEWGWLDIWLKMGFLGLLAFIWLGLFYLMSLWNSAKDQERGWLMIAFFRVVIALFVLHIFTPFLNHPIGLGFLVFLIPFLTPKKPKLSLESVRSKVESKKPRVQTAATTSSR